MLAEKRERLAVGGGRERVKEGIYESQLTIVGDLVRLARRSLQNGRVCGVVEEKDGGGGEGVRLR